MTKRKPPMRPLTPIEIAQCRSCTDGCWFGCETPIDSTIPPGQCWIEDDAEESTQ